MVTMVPATTSSSLHRHYLLYVPLKSPLLFLSHGKFIGVMCVYLPSMYPSLSSSALIFLFFSSEACLLPFLGRVTGGQ